MINTAKPWFPELNHRLAVKGTMLQPNRLRL